MSPRKSISWAASVALVVAGMVATAPSATAKPKQKAPGKVSSVKVSSVTASTAVLSWKNPKSKKNRKFTGTVIRVAAGTKAPASVKSGSAVASLGSKRTSVTVARLRPGAVYTVSIFSKGASKKYSKARAVRVQTAPAAVTSIYAQSTTDSIRVFWRLSSATTARTIVRYQAARTPLAVNTGVGAPVAGRATAVLLKNLRANTSYGVSLWAVDRNGRISPRASAAFRTAPATSGSVTGSVTEQGTGRRLANADVSLYDNATDNEYEVSTTSNGSFSLKGVLPGTYGLYASGDDASGGTSEAGYVGAQIDDIRVKAGTTMNFAVQLERGAGITGSVADPNDVPLADIDVEVEYANDFDDYTGTSSDDDGTFDIEQISSQNATAICFSDSDVAVNSDDSVTGYQENCLDIPDDVVLVPGQITEIGKNVLSVAGAIRGTVSFDTGSDDAYITVFDQDGEPVGYGFADDDEFSQYKVGGLAVNEDLYVCVSTREEKYGGQCYNAGGGVAWNGDDDDLPDFADLTPVTTAPGETTKNIDFALVS